MKREVSFGNDRRGRVTAKNLMATFKMLGMSDEEIRQEMVKWESESKPGSHSAKPRTETTDGPESPDEENERRGRGGDKWKN